MSQSLTAGVAPAKPGARSAGASAGLRVLLVEDAPLVRDVIARMLNRLGYEVLAVGELSAALALFEPGQFDVLLTDITLPEMSGAELAGRLRAAQPDLPVLYVSGHGPDDEHRGTADTKPLLRKPFAMAELGQAVARVAARR